MQVRGASDEFQRAETTLVLFVPANRAWRFLSVLADPFLSQNLFAAFAFARVAQLTAK